MATYHAYLADHADPMGVGATPSEAMDDAIVTIRDEAGGIGPDAHRFVSEQAAREALSVVPAPVRVIPAGGTTWHVYQGEGLLDHIEWGTIDGEGLFAADYDGLEDFIRLAFGLDDKVEVTIE